MIIFESNVYSIILATNLKILNIRGCFQIGECFAYTALALKFGFKSIEKFDLRDTDMADMGLACFR